MQQVYKHKNGQNDEKTQNWYTGGHLLAAEHGPLQSTGDPVRNGLCVRMSAIFCGKINFCGGQWRTPV